MSHEAMAGLVVTSGTKAGLAASSAASSRVFAASRVASALIRAASRVAQGEPLSQTLTDSRIASGTHGWMLQQAEAAGTLPQSLRRLAEICNRELEMEQQTIFAGAGPILISIAGLYEDLGKNKPPKGDEAEWKKKCEALVKAVKDGDKDAFKTAVGCGGCHSGFKPLNKAA